MTHPRRLAVLGWGLAVVAVPVSVDVWASVTKRPTMSNAWACAALHPVAGPIVVGASCGLLYHLGQSVVSEYARRVNEDVVLRTRGLRK